MLQSDCSVGIKEESVYGTAVVVDRWLEFLSENFSFDPEFLQGKGLRSGRVLPRASRRSIGKKMVSGDLEIEATSKGMGILLKAALGSVTNTIIGATTGYQQVHSPATNDMLPSFTIQKGVPLLKGGAVQPHTFSGMMCNKLNIAAKNGEIVTVKTSWLGRDMAVSPASGATAFIAPSYPFPEGNLLTFVGGQIYGGALGIIDGSNTTTALATSSSTPLANIVDFDWTWENGLDEGGFNLGGNGLRSRPSVIGERSSTGKITAEYDSNTLRDAFLAQTRLSFLLNFQTPVLAGTSTVPETLQIILPVNVLEGDIPASNGGDVIEQSIDFTGLDNAGAASPPRVLYVTSDLLP